VQYGTVQYGRSTTSKVIDFSGNQKGNCDFLLTVGLTLALYRTVFLRYSDLLAQNRHFSTSLLSGALEWGDPFRISGKALLILKLEFLWQLEVNIS